MTQTVLVVDDSSFITEGLSSILKRDYRTIISSGGEMCLEILKKETPDIIILDILMEPMDGWETLLRIRENPATRHIPVIMFSAKKISPFEAETHHPYIDEYITKPVSPRNLLDTIAKVLSRKEASRRSLVLWKQAGLQTEEIEEYARLMTSIEVDRGLCSNMEQQLSTERNDTHLREIQRSIEIIGTRIRKNMILAEEIQQRGEALVTAGGETDAVPGPMSSEAAGEDAQQIEGPRLSGMLQDDILSPGPAIIRDDPPAPETAPQREIRGIPGNPSGETETVVPAKAENRQVNENERKSSERSVTGPANLVQHEPERDDVNKTEKPVNADPGKRPVHTMEAIIPDTRQPDTAIPENVPEEEVPSPIPAQFPVLPQGNRERQEEQPRGVVRTTPLPPVQQVPASQKEPDTGSPKAAGSSGITRKSRTEPAQKTQESPVAVKSSSQVRAPESPGLLARIIAAIMSLFSRSKY
ncbi:response regulator [uncultured Methanoregula sp.]|uniref:response regulator n=1 Tax=uncultured Methanoregula sp. TaxID=1005933 RepID=UPI002AAA88D0|nr:response regulator [uncultured Methanoregula sp.]